MKEKDCLSDERLVLLHQQKRLNAFFTIYGRYKNYGYAIVYNTLGKYKLINALKDEKDAIIYDSIMECLNVFDLRRGTFRKLFNAVVANQTVNYVREFQKDPLSDYISLDTNIEESGYLRFADSLTLADKSGSPGEFINLGDSTKKFMVNYTGAHKRKIKKMMQLKEQGFTFREIAKKFKMSENAVRAVFYRIKRHIDVKENNKIKK